MHRLENLYSEQYKSQYPNLQIESWDCMGECELGPIVKINDTIVLREVQKEQVDELFSNPEAVLGEVQHVLEQDRETFDRIIHGELF